MFEEYTMDLCSTVNVELHSWRCDDIFDIAWDISDPATIFDAQCFHAGGDGEADRVLRSVWVCNYQIGFHRIQTARNAFHGSII